MMQRSALVVLVLLLVNVGLVAVPVVPIAEAQAGDIGYQPSIIEDVAFTYDRVNHWFELSYQDYYMRFRPFAIYKGEVYTQPQIVAFLKSQGASYRDIIQRVKHAIHWGFEVAGIPADISANLDYLGFKLTDYNFDLSVIEVEEQTAFTEDGYHYNFTTFSIPRINLAYSFQDLQEAGYTVEIVNRTYLLIGNVGDQADLLIDPITYSAPTITVTGGPYTFASIAAADIAGGWGVFTQFGTNGFYCTAKLVIGDGSTATTFSDASKVIVVDDLCSANNEVAWRFLTAATVTFGVLVDAGNHVTRDGCHFIFTEDHWDCRYPQIECDAYFYSCSLQVLGAARTKFYILSGGVNTRVWNTQFQKNLYFDTSGSGYGDFFSVTISGVVDATWGVAAALARCSFFPTQYVIRHYSKATTDVITDLYARGYGNDLVYTSGGSGSLSLVDADVSNWNISWAGTSTRIIYRQYTVNLVVKDAAGDPIEDANVTLYNYDSSAAFSALTGASGTIAEQTVSYGFYNQTGGDVMYEYGPFTLTVTAAGCMPYVYEDLALNEPLDWRIYLRDQLEGTAQPWSVLEGATFYSTDADTLETGTWDFSMLGEVTVSGAFLIATLVVLVTAFLGLYVPLIGFGGLCVGLIVIPVMDLSNSILVMVFVIAMGLNALFTILGYTARRRL
jgi:hypothetical protein